MVYYNRYDPKVVVPKRFGLGWTFNFAHNISWIFILLVAGIAVAVSILAK